MSKGTVLVVGSHAAAIDVRDGHRPTSNYLNETIVPVWAIQDAGYTIVFVTPDGTKPRIDAASDIALDFGGDEEMLKRARAFYSSDPSMNQVRTLRSVIDQGLDNFAGMFVAARQPAVIDLMQDTALGEILRYCHSKQKPTSFLCHGPIVTIAAMRAAQEFRAAFLDGDTAKAVTLAKGWQYAGYTMTVLGAGDETRLEDALKIAGANVSTSDTDFEPHVTEDRELICGQNARSDHQLGTAFVAALDRAAMA